MKTEKIYYTDAYLAEIESRIVDLKENKDGFLIALDKTVIYPGGGGQPADKAAINGAEVKKITEDGELVWYLSAAKGLKKGRTVRLDIDWGYRFSNMQKHSGQHLLSSVLHRHGFETVSVHLGDTAVMVEFEGGFPNAEMFTIIERDCAELISRALPIKTHWAGRKDIDQYPLRRAAADRERTRIVEIEGIDFSACGGTHLKNSAEIGLIKVVGAEKIRGRARIKALIGQSAYRYFAKLHGIITELKTELPADIDHISDRVKKIKEETRVQNKLKEYYQNLYIEGLCDSFTLEEENILFYKLPDGQEDDLQRLAACLVKKNKLNAFLVCGNKFCFVTTDDSSWATSVFLKDYRENFGIRGGGKPGFIRGTMESYTEMELKETLKNLKENI